MMNLIIFTDDEKYRMHCDEYKALWSYEGKKIQESFNRILSVPFKENKIKLLINAGKNNSNFSGENEEDIMNFRYNNRCKIGTFLHELSHRIIMEYSMLEKAKKIYEINDIHEIVDLFLFDVIADLYGEDAAKLRVEYESNFEEEIYKNSWEHALKLSFEERQIKIKNILDVNIDE